MVAADAAMERLRAGAVDVRGLVPDAVEIPLTGFRDVQIISLVAVADILAAGVNLVEAVARSGRQPEVAERARLDPAVLVVLGQAVLTEVSRAALLRIVDKGSARRTPSVRGTTRAGRPRCRRRVGARARTTPARRSLPQPSRSEEASPVLSSSPPLKPLLRSRPVDRAVLPHEEHARWVVRAMHLGMAIDTSLVEDHSVVGRPQRIGGPWSKPWHSPHSFEGCTFSIACLVEACASWQLRQFSRTGRCSHRNGPRFSA